MNGTKMLKIWFQKRLNFATTIIISEPMQSQIEGTVNVSNNYDDDESPILDKRKG
jgi:hypothetical protein